MYIYIYRYVTGENFNYLCMFSILPTFLNCLFLPRTHLSKCLMLQACIRIVKNNKPEVEIYDVNLTSHLDT